MNALERKALNDLVPWPMHSKVPARYAARTIFRMSLSLNTGWPTVIQGKAVIGCPSRSLAAITPLLGASYAIYHFTIPSGSENLALKSSPKESQAPSAAAPKPENSLPSQWINLKTKARDRRTKTIGPVATVPADDLQKKEKEADAKPIQGVAANTTPTGSTAAAGAPKSMSLNQRRSPW